tara:strand:+ start:9317 stop:9502 length:186 start_codon:yes stop_codon:yes gene_type:complete
MEIRIKKDCYIRGHWHKEGTVVIVSSAEAKQYISSGLAHELDYSEKKPSNKKETKTKKRAK